MKNSEYISLLEDSLQAITVLKSFLRHENLSIGLEVSENISIRLKTALEGLCKIQNNMSKVRAKFKCFSVEEFAGGNKKANLSAVYSTTGENAQFAHATPSGNLSISIDSQTEAVNFFQAGEEYYLDFSLVPKAVAE